MIKMTEKEIMENKKIFRTIEDYLPELNSEAFSRIAEESVKYTQKTGCEAGFVVHYSNLPQSTRDRIEKYPELKELMLKKFGGIEPRFTYPSTIRTGTKRSLQWTLEDLPATVIKFHTHPEMYFKQREGEPLFSYEDLRSLNAVRRNFSRHNPISIVLKVNTPKRKERVFPVVITQEKSDFPLSEDFDFKFASEGMQNILFCEENGSTEGDLRNPRFFPSYILESYQLASEHYNIKRGRMTFGEGFSFE